ncbi:hypothetical protein Taro_025138 [Colocasia esculenta]|uniref:Uncharacterized protein n=1 Tax=Colocasia esculenta TaxID=4460 RepID=A0A843VDC8_COLES|nr:hypothetical protein [Colocasia esculenta]
MLALVRWWLWRISRRLVRWREAGHGGPLAAEVATVQLAMGRSRCRGAVQSGCRLELERQMAGRGTRFGVEYSAAAVGKELSICVTRIVRLGGPPDWAQSAHRFSTCERDRGVCHVLNATAQVVAFLLPLLGGLRLHGCRTNKACSFGRLEVLKVRGACSHLEDVVWSGGNAKGSLVFAFFTKRCGFLWRHVGASRSEGDLAPYRDLSRASALVTLTKRVAHDVGMFYVVNVLCVVLVGLHSCLTCSRGAAVGPFVRDCETERLFLCCVVRSRFDPFEVCPGVGTVVTAVMACGAPEWWHSFGYGWYLYPVWVMVYGVLLPTYLRLACEAYSLDCGLPVRPEA